MKSRAAIFHGPGLPLELISIDLPPLDANEILVRVLGCTLCRSDLHSFSGRRAVETPIILGHEVIGRIEAIGPATSSIDYTGRPSVVGDRITWSIIVGCGKCFFCTHDLPQKCQGLYKYGHEQLEPGGRPSGGLADFVVLRPGTAWLRVSDQVPDSIGAIANCAAATAAAVIRYAGPLEGQNVLILGCGVLGALTCSMASVAGARQVLAVDPNPSCRARARAFGATAALAADVELALAVFEATHGVGADIVLDLAGSAESCESALSTVRVGGSIVLAGAVAPCKTVPLDPEMMVRRMITLRGVHNYHPRDLASAVQFLDEHLLHFPVQSLVTEKYALESVNDAFRQAETLSGVRVLVAPT
jgi:alcohol dehydrogenase